MSTRAVNDNFSPNTVRRLFRSTFGTERFGTSFQKIRELHPPRNNGLQPTDSITCVYAQDEFLFTGTTGGAILVWNKTDLSFETAIDRKTAVCDDKERKELETTSDIGVISLIVRNTRIFAAYEDRKIIIWDAKKNSSGYLQSQILRIPDEEKKPRGYIRCISATIPASSESHCYLFAAYQDIIYWWRITTKKADVTNMNPVDEGQADAGLPTKLETSVFDDKGNPVNITSMYVHHHNLFCGFTNGVIKLWKKTETDFQLGPEFTKHHSGYIFAMKATSKLLYTAGEEGVVYLWELSETGPIDATSTIGVKSFAHPILSMAVCHNLIVVHQSHCIKTYMKDSLQLVQNIEIPQKVRAFTIDRSKNGGIYLGASDCTIWQYNVTPSGHVQTIDHEASVRCIAVDTERIYSGSVDKIIRVFNKKTHALQYVLPNDSNNHGHTRPVRCITIDDDYIYSGGEDGQVIVWSKKTHRDVKVLQITDHVTIEKSDDNHRYDPNFASVTAIVVDDSYIYAGSERGFIQIWDKKSFQYQITLLNSRDKDQVCPIRALAVYKGFLLCNYIGSVNLFKLSKVNLYINMVQADKDLRHLSFNRKHEKIQLDSTISYTTGLAVYKDLIYVTRSSTFDTSKTTSLIAKSRDRHPGEIVIMKIEDPDVADKVLFDIDNYYSAPARMDVDITGNSHNYPILVPEVVELTELVKKPVKATDPHTLVVTQGRIFVACENGYIQIRDAQTGKLLIKTNLHNQWIYALSVNEGKVYTGSYDKTLRMWDYELYHYFSTLTDSQVAQNNNTKNCWVIFDNKVYDLNQTHMKESNDIKYKGMAFPSVANWLSTKTCKEFLVNVSKHTSTSQADVLVDSYGTLRDSSKNSNNNNSGSSYETVIIAHIAGRDITHLCTQIYKTKEDAFAALNIKEYFIGKLNGKHKKAVHYFMPDFLRKCYSEGTFANQESFEQYLDEAKRSASEDDEEPLFQRDHMDKNALMMCAISGNLKNTKLLVANGCNFSMMSKYEENALFFAMKYNRWQYLLDLKNWYKLQEKSQRSRANSVSLATYSAITIRDGVILEYNAMNSSACTELLLARARDGDVTFFRHVFECGIIFDKRIVLKEAIKYNQRRILEFWPSSEWDSTFALHSACYYGQHALIDLIVSQEGIQVDECDPTNAYRTALHVCHLSAKYSEYNDYSQGKNRGWIAPKIYSAYEHDLIVARSKCFDEIMSAPATKVRVPNLRIFAKDGKTSYDQALNLHKYALQRRKAPQREQTDSDQIARNKSVFDSTVQSLQTFHKQEQIIDDRARFANTQFCLEAFPYLLFLILISVVGILSATNLTSNSYNLSTAVGAHFRGDSSAMPYYSIGSESEYWDWLENTFVPAVYEYAPSNSSSPNFVLKNNLLLGSVRMRQLKVRNDSCRVRELYEENIKYCYSAGFTIENNDKMTFGSSNQFVYDENEEGDEFWNGGDFYPSGGFIQDLPVTNQTKALEIIQNLKSNEWISKGTRMVLISMTLYNANLNGAFVVLRFPAQFSAVGDVTPTNEINVMSPYSYDTDFVSGTEARIAIEVLCFIYFMYAFFATEFAEMYQEYRIQDRRNKQLALLGEATEHTKSRLVLLGRAQLAYWSQYWNYYEWLMIFTFFALIVLRILTSGAFNTLNLHPQPDEFLNIHRQAFIFAYYRSLLSIFISLAWLRMLKFLRIPSSFGPIIQSIMDTLKARKVVVFMLVVVYMVVLFGLTFHLSFGYNVTAYQRWTDSMITMFQLLFQQFDYESMYDSNKVFGVIYFIGVVLLLIFLLMNLLISVLGNAYEEVEQVNEAKWNRNITKMMIRALTDRASYGKQPLLREIIQRSQNIPFIPSFLRPAHIQNVSWFLSMYDSLFHYKDKVGTVSYDIITLLFTENPYSMDPYKILKDYQYEIDFFVEEKISEFSGQIKLDTKEKLIMSDDDQMDLEILEQEKNSEIIEKDNFLSALVAENSEITLASIQEFIRTQNADAHSTKELDKRIEKVENQLAVISKQTEKILKLLKK